jgi:HEAT repeat protein
MQHARFLGAAVIWLVLAGSAGAEAPPPKDEKPAVKPPDAKQIQQLIDELGSKDFQSRERAARRLTEIGTPALPALQEALKNGDAEVRRRVEKIIDSIKFIIERELDKEYEELLTKDKDAETVRKAAELFAGTNQNSRWTQYADATAVLRRSRSKAGIPLLLKYMILHSEYGSSHIIIPEYVDTFVILTGKELPDPYRYVADRRTPVRNAVEELFKTWWLPNKDKISTDLGAMTREQLQCVIERLLQRVERSARDYSSEDSPTRNAYRLAAVFTRQREDRRDKLAEQELHLSMVPLILERLGYDAQPPVLPVRETYALSLGSVRMLGLLRQNGEATVLDKVAGDTKQNSAVRLTSLLAMHAAGEDLKTSTLLELLKSEKKLERRVLMILALAHSDDAKNAVPVLLELLDNSNRHIRAAAVEALSTSKPKEALPKLKKMLAAPSNGNSVYSILRLVAGIGTREAQVILADFLKATLEDGSKGPYLLHTLHAFEQATGQDWSEAGAHAETYYRDRAREALAWWKDQQK